MEQDHKKMKSVSARKFVNYLPFLAPLYFKPQVPNAGFIFQINILTGRNKKNPHQRFTVNGAKRFVFILNSIMEKYL
ncbi:MAG: hypothetical protein MJ196_06610 [Treponemataceae bacterium]|nr:hypothetical protein [Treponemataceae bacterium]